MLPERNRTPLQSGRQSVANRYESFYTDSIVNVPCQEVAPNDRLSGHLHHSAFEDKKTGAQEAPVVVLQDFLAYSKTSAIACLQLSLIESALAFRQSRIRPSPA